MEKSVEQALLEAINSAKSRGQTSRLAEVEPYLLQPLDIACQGAIPDNDDYRIEDLSSDDLAVPIHVA